MNAHPTPPGSSDPYRGLAIGSVLLFVLMLPVLIFVAHKVEPTAKGPPVVTLASSKIVENAGGIPALLASKLYTEGRQQFISTCTACHGPEGQAKPHLGKDIANSAFVAARTDDQMVAYIKAGRPVSDPLNTTGVPMPPKGGNPALTDEQIHQIIAYIRVLQAAARGDIQLPSSTPSTPPAAQTTSASAGSSSSPKPAPAPSQATIGKLASSAIVDKAGGVDKLLTTVLYTEGRELFITSCTACHGPQGQAKPHLGKDIAHSMFVAGRTDDQMVSYIKTGRPVDDPLNTTGVPMPPKGGNPALTDEQIHKIIAYIRVLQAAAMGDVRLPPSPTG